LQTIGSYNKLSCETKRLFWQDDRMQSLVGKVASLELVLKRVNCSVVNINRTMLRWYEAYAMI